MKLSPKKPRLVIGKILELFVNTFTADGKYSLVNYDNLRNQFRWYYPRNKKLFPIYFVKFSTID